MSVAFRRLLAGLIGASLVIGLTALPLSAAKPAPEKIFSLEVLPAPGGTYNGLQTSGPVTSGGTATFSPKLYNRTPGNSNFNSFEVNVPASFSITGATRPAGLPANLGYTVSVAGNKVTVSGLDPVKQGTYASVDIAVSVAPASCSVTYSGAWAAVAYTGAPGSTAFRQLSDVLAGEPNAGVTADQLSRYLVTQIDPSCGIRFGTQPHDAAAGDVITGTDLDPTASSRVTVEIYNASGVDTSVDSGTVTLTRSSGPTSGVLSGATATFLDGVATFSTLSIGNGATAQAAGDYALQASYSGFTASSDTFTIYDDLICPDPGVQDAEYSESGPASSIALNSQDQGCFGITVDNELGGFVGTRRTDTWEVVKSNGTEFKGYLTFDWTLTGTSPIPWTEVTWTESGGAVVDYHPVQLCNPGVSHTDSTKYSEGPGGLFPAGEKMCLVDSDLGEATIGGSTVYVQHEIIAYNADLGSRKG